jgi:hypothetical protein
MQKTKWLDLQLFADGADGAAGEGTADGAAGEITAVDAEQQRLRELGVPEDKLKRRAKRAAARLPENAVRTQPQEKVGAESEVQAAAADTLTEKTEAPTARMSWDEIMADPEYNRQMQSVVQARLKSAKGAEEALAKLTPALEVLARKHGLDSKDMDYAAIAKAVSEDDAYYEERALQMGVPVETAKRIDQQERDNDRQQRENARTIEEQAIRRHVDELRRQEEEMKKIFPSFDLRRELEDPTFRRMTSPSGGVSVKAAYYAVHHDELQMSAMQEAAKRTAQKMSDAIRSGSVRPDENGISGQAPSVTTFNYRNATPAQRDALKKRIREAAARGEKLYPGK